MIACYHLNCPFFNKILVEFSIPLNKFEKKELVKRLFKEGKVYREVCKLAHVSPRDIKPIAKEYERKKRLVTKKEEK